MTLTALKESRPAFRGIETFELPEGVTSIRFISDDVVVRCPVTGQPDQYMVEIACQKPLRTIEATSLKLYFQQLRDEGIFCEELAAKVARDVRAAAEAESVEVDAELKPREGIGVIARAVAPVRQ